MTLGLPEDSGAEMIPVTGAYLRDNKTVEGTVYTEAKESLSLMEQQKADLRSKKREEKRRAKYDRKKARADKRAARKKARAIRKGNYPGLPRHSFYFDEFPTTNLAKKSSFGSPTQDDDIGGKI